MKKICAGALAMCILFCLSGCKKSQEEPKTTEKKQIETTAKKQPERTRDVASSDANLSLVKGTGNTLGIDLTNKIPVRGVQFTLSGVNITDVNTTPRTEGLSANFNQETGIVILISLTGESIAPGTGPIAEITCEEEGSPSLKYIKIGK